MKKVQPLGQIFIKREKKLRDFASTTIPTTALLNGLPSSLLPSILSLLLWTPPHTVYRSANFVWQNERMQKIIIYCRRSLREIWIVLNRVEPRDSNVISFPFLLLLLFFTFLVPHIFNLIGLIDDSYLCFVTLSGCECVRVCFGSFCLTAFAHHSYHRRWLHFDYYLTDFNTSPLRFSL